MITLSIWMLNSLWLINVRELTNLRKEAKSAVLLGKLGRQKGGGGARRGDINSPVLVGGARVFGPKPRDTGLN